MSEDKTSWRAGGVLRRDFRSERGAPEIPKTSLKRRHGKKCKRTCFGKPELPHQWVPRPSRYDWPQDTVRVWHRWVIVVCTRCGRNEFFTWPKASETPVGGQGAG